MDSPPSVILDEAGSPRVVWRGEIGGELFDNFDLAKTQAKTGFFFAENKGQADSYAARGTKARAFHLHAERVLDLTDPYSPPNIDFIKAFAQEFDEWIDRVSGEEMDAFAFLEAGSLYDYEGTGHGNRWYQLFRFASGEGFDAVRVIDATDGLVAPVWVVFEPDQIVKAEPPTPDAEAPARRMSRTGPR